MAKRIQRRRVKGWRMPANAKYVGRGSRWGNRFVVGRDGTAAECVAKYREWLCEGLAIDDPDLPGMLWIRALDVDDLRGKDLACWCKVLDENGNRVPCHADVLLELLAEQESSEVDDE